MPSCDMLTGSWSGLPMDGVGLNLAKSARRYHGSVSTSGMVLSKAPAACSFEGTGRPLTAATALSSGPHCELDVRRASLPTCFMRWTSTAMESLSSDGYFGILDYRGHSNSR